MTVLLQLSVLCTLLLTGIAANAADTPSGKLLLKDDFEREETNPGKEEVGNGWTTNSRSRAKGEKQVDLDEGAMHITRAAVADHGVSVVHDLKFTDVTIRLRFKLGEKDSLGINIADTKEKSVHAGHICLALIRRNRLEIADLKTGRMNLEIRTRRVNDKTTADDKKLLKQKSKYFKINLAADEWHKLDVHIKGDVMRVAIDEKPVGEFQSPGIGHAMKSRLRLAVAKSAWVDDVEVWGQ